MKDKVSQVCDYLLDRIESGEFSAGEPIPSARKIGKEVNASFAMILQAVNALSGAGILHCVNRQGSMVQPDWDKRLMPNHFVLFNPRLPWIPGFRKLVEEKLPEMRLCSRFRYGMFEVRTTLPLQQDRDEYLDLAPYFDELFPDRSLFFEAPFRSFRNSDGSIHGIPFIFSPRVMFCNPRLLESAGVEMPSPDWTFDDFLNLLSRLKTHFPAENLLNYSQHPFFWMNFVFRSNGALIDPNAESPVRIDSPETIRGIELLRSMHKHLKEVEDPSWLVRFCNGRMPFVVAERELLCHLKHSGMTDWRVLPLPHIPGGADRMAQATDLLCVRKECVNRELILDFLRFMLSEEVQDYIAAEKYGIPIRKSSAQKSIDISDPRDVLFLTEMNAMSGEYNLDSPELTTLIQEGVIRIINDTSLPLKESLEDLAHAVRVFLDIKNTVIRTA
ncbi:MAG: extracellular solute-binding protein [Victivallales bacterium]|jgi:regulatory protein gntR HTH